MNRYNLLQNIWNNEIPGKRELKFLFSQDSIGTHDLTLAIRTFETFEKINSVVNLCYIYQEESRYCKDIYQARIIMQLILTKKIFVSDMSAIYKTIIEWGNFNDFTTLCCISRNHRFPHNPTRDWRIKLAMIRKDGEAIQTITEISYDLQAKLENEMRIDMDRYIILLLESCILYGITYCERNMLKEIIYHLEQSESDYKSLVINLAICSFDENLFNYCLDSGLSGIEDFVMGGKRLCVPNNVVTAKSFDFFHPFIEYNPYLWLQHYLENDEIFRMIMKYNPNIDPEQLPMFRQIKK
jgi:hypothetical protein